MAIFKLLWKQPLKVYGLILIVFTGFTDLKVTFQDIVKTEISDACNGLNLVTYYILYPEYIKYLFLWMNVNGTVPTALVYVLSTTHKT